MTRDQYIAIYNSAKAIAEGAFAGRRTRIFKEAQSIASIVEGIVGQIGARPASTWDMKTGTNCWPFA